MEDRTTVHRANSVDEEAESSEPSSSEEEVSGPMDEAASEGEEPEQGQEDGHCSDDLGVDVASSGPGMVVMEAMEVRANDACDDAERLLSVEVSLEIITAVLTHAAKINSPALRAIDKRRERIGMVKADDCDALKNCLDVSVERRCWRVEVVEGKKLTLWRAK